jgi:predicted dehydrogenase
MGHRHVRGLGELERAGESRFDLVAVCDPDETRAASIVHEAQESLGETPRVWSRLDELDGSELDSVTITTPPMFHAEIIMLALGRGWHVLVEKPLAPTVEVCRSIESKVQQHATILSVAENFRRDPMNRLLKALLDAGLIGEPRYLLQQARGGGDQMIITEWRHRKEQGGPVMDIGVHNADMMEYLFGPVRAVYARAGLERPSRRNPAATGGASASDPGGVYRRWQEQMPAVFEATGEDVASAFVEFHSGAVCHYREDHAGAGPGMWRREIYGTTGWIECPRDRSGDPVVLHSADHGTLRGGEVLDLVPHFGLDPVASKLFGGDRLGGYRFPFAETDRKILAIEYAELADRAADGRPVEVDAATGRRAVALIEAIFASSASGKRVDLEGG